MCYYVYVIKSLKTGYYYKGLTNNIDRRLKQHENGKCQTTSSMLPIKLTYVEIVKNRLEARKLEKYLKTGYGREIIKEIEDAEVAEW